jgi:AraC-like DNA-binding protein
MIDFKEIMNTSKHYIFKVTLLFGILLNPFFADKGYSSPDNYLPNEIITASDLVIISGDQTVNRDSIQEYKKLAIEFAQKKNSKEASLYLDKYIKASLNTHFIKDEVFSSIKQTEDFEEVAKKYELNFSFINLFYLFSSVIGIFIVIILNSNRKSDNRSIVLISSFILIHSIFIFHIFLFLSRLQFRFPHTLFMSIIFSFLYGPLIYFYFKRIVLQHVFKWIDLLHIIPTALIIIAVLPIYLLSAEEKLMVMLHASEIDRQAYVNYTFMIKLLSLAVYGFLLFRIYFKYIKNNPKISFMNIRWQKSIIWLGAGYIISYAIYGLIIIDVLPRIEFLYHLQIFFMALMVLYIGFMAYLRPNIFKSDYFEPHLYKYKKSGLTPRFSQELKEHLLHLMNVEKVYRKNDINLEELSEKLGTTRHNTSQVINEHFNMNFFEFINKFRIEEAKEILKNDTEKYLNIIDVAYEVGFNNKVTFNKSFKKILSQTPTQYLSALRASF